MFEGFTAKLHAIKIAKLKEAEIQAIQKEKEILEIEKLEGSIDKHKQAERRRNEKRLARLKKLQYVLGKLTPQDENKMDQLNESLKGSSNVGEEERTEKTNT